MSSEVDTTPIAELRIHQTNWTIKACITSKSDVRTWSNSKGQGKFFWIKLKDASSSMTIRATFFRDAVDQFYRKLHANKIYTFSGGQLKLANKKYNTCKSNLEIVFDVRSEIQPFHTTSGNGVAMQRQERRNEAMMGTSSGVIQTGVWREEQMNQKEKDYQALLWKEEKEENSGTPVHDKCLTDDERAKMRDRRAAAAKARAKKTSGKKQKKEGCSYQSIFFSTHEIYL